MGEASYHRRTDVQRPYAKLHDLSSNRYLKEAEE